ncbi:heme exporter protein B [Tistrella bauzanensis]|uniref:Heme exporter protein B n=1 Tax=Tistrella bauzanensis TaxID=657419 RepID=A0ABQ1ICW2_9PROT|nr:heme exporter protein CcmB [Tistrella bauzanensis]GGB33940.1 heme exporter protein B [Tistrella bauzanensis]
MSDPMAPGPSGATPGLGRTLLAVLRRDLARTAGRSGDVVAVLAFFVVAATLFPLGVGPGPQVLSRIASGVVWASALLAVLLSLDRLFDTDRNDGALEALALAPAPLALVVVAKVVAHWLTTGLPLIVAAPVVAIMLQIDSAVLGTLMLSLAVGTPALSLIGAIGAALTLGARRGAALMPLLLLPLYVPVLIFGVGAVEAAANGLPTGPHLMLLGAGSVLALALAPLAAAAGLRAALD